MICAHCGSDPGLKPGSSVVWNGFEDQDNRQLCCFGCRERHYLEKAKAGMQGLYSEFPVIIRPSPLPESAPVPKCLGKDKCMFMCAGGVGWCPACGFVDEPGGVSFD